jgi:hypothetical protein
MPCAVETTDPGSAQYAPAGIASGDTVATASVAVSGRASRTIVASAASASPGGGFALSVEHDAAGIAATNPLTIMAKDILEAVKATVIGILPDKLATEGRRREKR